MTRSGRSPRRLILGILFVSVSVLTALSLPGLGFARSSGLFAQIWVQSWVGFFGVPAVWLIVVFGLLWGLAFLLRWRRAFLWGLTLLVWPFLIAWDAFLISVVLAGNAWLLHGWFGSWLHATTRSFFGWEATLQVAVALGSLSLAITILLLRWGLPRPVSDWIGQGLTATARGLRLTAMLLGRSLWWLVDLTVRGVVCPLARMLWRAIRVLGRSLAGLADRAVARLRAQTPRPAMVGVALGANSGHAVDPVPDESLPLPVELEGERRGPAADPLGNYAERERAAFAESGSLEDAHPDGTLGSVGSRRAGRVPTPGTGKTRPAGACGNVPLGPAVATLDLLQEGGSSVPVSQEEMRANAMRLKETLASFGIEGEVEDVHPGPVITQYEFAPGVGVTISQITSRQDDLALALRAPRVRLLAPIPGKAAVGVEIPNREPALISFKEIAARPEFMKAGGALTLALGKDVGGRPFYTALDSMPHLLVAGTTGSGKSVCLNTLIVSLLLRCDPECLRLLLIDPKMLELSVYNGIPHLLKPVLTDNREAARALQWLTREMERRYRVFAGVAVRSIKAYRERRAQARPEDGELEPMPYIVVFVDELADLMMSNQSEVEIPIARLAQMARAVGIHLVLATQRPSVDVITGVIKANFPARMAFQVASRTDSRTILDMNGAESLIGRGDMLFIPPGKAQAHRIHGAFIGDAEIESIAAYLRQFPPAEDFAPVMDLEKEEMGPREIEDPLFNEALRIVVATRQGSTSFLQRRLRIGYTRAGRLMDMLEHAGIVGPPDGSRARDILVPPDYLDETCEQAPAGIDDD